MPDVLITPASSSIEFKSGSSDVLVGEIDLNGSNLSYSSSRHLFTGSVTITALTASVFGTSSWANNSLTASFLPTGTYQITSSWAQSSSAALNARTASFLPLGTYNITSSWSNNSISASYAQNIGNGVTSIAGTSNQVLVNGGTSAVTGAVTLTLPQNISTTSTPSFSSVTLSDTNIADTNQLSGSITKGLRLNAGEGFSIYGNTNFFGTNADAILIQMEDNNSSGGTTDGGFVFRGFSPTGTSPTASNWMTIRTGALVGINTMSPSSYLHVFENTSNTGTSTGVTIEQSGSGDAVLQYLLTGGQRWVTGIDNSDGDKYKIASSSDLDTNAALTINSSGNVGIGTTNPINKLDVAGNISASSITASLFFGTASWAQSSSAALNARTASFLPTGTYQITSSWANNSISASYVNVSALNAFVQGGNSFGANAMLGINDNYRLDIEQNGSAVISITQSRVGIGTTVPASGVTLTVATSSRITEGASNTGILQFGLADTIVGYSASIFNIRTYDGSGYFEALRTNGLSRYTLLAPITGSVGIGTTNPTSKLDIRTTVRSSTVLQAQGTNGVLFSVVDDLSDSLMSVNDASGLPVLEVFADDRIVAGQYNSNDFVIRNNKVGVGTNNPSAKLHITGSASEPLVILEDRTTNGDVDIRFVPATTANTYTLGIDDSDSDKFKLSYSSSLGTNDRFVVTTTGNVGIGTSNPSARLDVTLSGSSAGTASNANIIAMQKGSASVQQYYLYGSTYNNTINYTVGSDVNDHVGQNLYYSGVLRLSLNTYWGSYINNVNFSQGGLGVGTTSTTHGYGLFVNNGSVSGSTRISANASQTRYIQVGNTGSSAATNTFFVRMDDNGISSMRIQNLDAAAVANHGAGILANLSNNTGSDVLTAGGIYWLKENVWTNDTNSYDSYLRFDTAQNNTSDERMRITSAGNVGIGSTAPVAKLDVVTGSAVAAAKYVGLVGIGGAPSTTNPGQLYILGAGSESSTFPFKFDAVAMDTTNNSTGKSLNGWLKVRIENVTNFNAGVTYYIPVYV